MKPKVTNDKKDKKDKTPKVGSPDNNVTDDDKKLNGSVNKNDKQS